MSSKEQRRAAQLRRQLTSSPRQVQAIEPELAQAFGRAGACFATPTEAALIWNSAVTLNRAHAPQLAVVMGAGAVIVAVDEVVARLCGVPPDPEQPFAALPEWALELFKRIGIIRPPAPAEDPNASPKPVETHQEMLERAAKAGIVLA